MSKFTMCAQPRFRMQIGGLSAVWERRVGEVDRYPGDIYLLHTL